MVRKFNRSLFFLINGIVTSIIYLSGCTSPTAYAPVVNAWLQPAARSSIYRVKQDDTLYSIAWAFGLDYRALAAVNHIKPPYAIHVGQVLRMTTVARGEYRQITQPIHVAKQKLSRIKTLPLPRFVRNWTPPSRWVWPAQGKVVQEFLNTLAGDKGIDIAGKLGEPIYAAAKGKVVYSGDGVRGYGNLIIVKHNNSYLSAYAFNQKIRVKLGDQVYPGEKIAEMGRDNAGKIMLHFEIRRNGEPVNPLKYLR